MKRNLFLLFIAVLALALVTWFGVLTTSAHAASWAGPDPDGWSWGDRTLAHSTPASTSTGDLDAYCATDGYYVKDCIVEIWQWDVTANDGAGDWVRVGNQRCQLEDHYLCHFSIPTDRWTFAYAYSPADGYANGQTGVWRYLGPHDLVVVPIR